MKRVLFALFILISFQNIHAQYTDIINSKRPGFSESPYGVGTDVYQFEAGLFYRDSNTKNLFESTNTFGGELFFRFSKFIERLEVNLNVAYQGDELNYPLDISEKISGISDLRFGAKYLIYEQKYTDKSKEIRSWKARNSFDTKRLIPSVGIYGGVNTNFLSEDYKKEGITFKGAVLLQNDFSDRLVLLTNLIVDEITTENMLYSYIVTMTYAINHRWSFFIENVGKYQKTYTNNYQLGTGAAYLFSPNLQLDASVRTNLVAEYSYVYASAGVSWRLDRHQDALIQTNAPTRKAKNKRGFFSRLFGGNS
ncbi:Putative MetA-pathway of phenol degradation [Lutibacter agarilyticus]|uniref:Putative MetA-pathway of phenol degradation n=1 Tax=Lutibacter agarilyticus TaxID=1109740 RepID=A0A238X0J5_9FLAO|nr:transporter [Lutibacter agarilyticus]SNR52024.1 Putative MetA-pathway of phenol degradation [Lutibacter agarilyticus]